MKQILLALVIICLCITTTTAIRVTFQDYILPGDATSSDLTYTSSGSGQWAFRFFTPAVGNVSLDTYHSHGDSLTLFNKVPSAFSYAAADVSDNGANYKLLDSNGNEIYSNYFGLTNGRVEVKIIGMQPTMYKDGVLYQTGPALSIYPSYMVWGPTITMRLSNIIVGGTDHHVVTSLPSNWTIQRDLLNPAATGVYAWSGSNWVLQNSVYFYNDADKEYGSVADPYPENLVIKDYATQTVVNTTVVNYVHNPISYNVSQFLNTPTSLGTSLPDGMYTVSFESSPAVTASFWVISSGATMAWAQPIYSQGSTGEINYAIAGGGYWDQSTYSYSMVTKSLYGTTMNTQTIGAQSGTISVPITASYSPGVYYAEILATKISDGTVSTMNYAVMQVTSYIPMNGYVMNEETGAVIPSANMNISQGSQYQTVTTDANGTWSSNNGWMAGSTITINTTATGFKQDIHSFLPLNAASVFLNISMSPTVSAYSGVSIGGVVTDNKFGNPVVGALYHVKNGTESVSTTNIAGFARVDGLVNNNMYAVWSSKTGYGNSTIANVTAVSS